MNEARVPKTSRRAKLAALICPVVVGTLIIVSGTAYADETPPVTDELSLAGLRIDTSIALAKTEQAETAVLATGSVYEDGNPVQGAAVVARIWPNSTELAAVPEGGAADVKVIDLVYADANGNFAVRLDPGLVPQTHIEEGGFVNVELWVIHDGHEVPWNFPVLMPSRSARERGSSTSWTTQALQAKELSGPVDVVFELGDRPNVKQSDDPATEWTGSSGSTLADEVSAGDRATDQPGLADGGVAVAPAATTICWGAVPAGGTWYYNNREKFMTVWGWSGAKASVSQSVGSASAHTLGVGYKSTTGSWGANGTSTISSSTSAAQTRSGILNENIYNSVNYRKWNCSLFENNETIIGYEMRPASFYDIFNEPIESIVHGNYTLGCVSKSAGTTVTKSSGTNTTYSGGVSTPLVALSARSGYNTGTTLKFTVTAASKICGNDASGWINASRVDMHSQ